MSFHDRKTGKNRGLAVLLLSALLLPAVAWSTPLQHVGGMINPDTYHGLVADRRAHRVGDTLTVLVVQASRASAAANTDSGNDVHLGADVHSPHTRFKAGLGLSGSDSGAGQTTRSGLVQTQIAVRVTAVDAVGNLHIHGEQSLIINGETQRIALDGVIRPEDIAADNTIASNRIADAHIAFTGRGDISEPQKRSVIYRFMTWLGLL